MEGKEELELERRRKKKAEEELEKKEAVEELKKGEELEENVEDGSGRGEGRVNMAREQEEVEWE